MFENMQKELDARTAADSSTTDKVSPSSQTIAKTNVRRSIISVLFENHSKGNSDWNDSWKSCNCSYCKGKNKLHYGLNIPSDWKSWNSWWVIKYGKTKYLRWTNSWLQYFA